MESSSKLLPPHTVNYMSMEHNLHIKKLFLVQKSSAVLRCASRIKIITFFFSYHLILSKIGEEWKRK